MSDVVGGRLAVHRGADTSRSKACVSPPRAVRHDPRRSVIASTGNRRCDDVQPGPLRCAAQSGYLVPARRGEGRVATRASRPGGRRRRRRAATWAGIHLDDDRRPRRVEGRHGRRAARGSGSATSCSDYAAQMTSAGPTSGQSSSRSAARTRSRPAEAGGAARGGQAVEHQRRPLDRDDPRRGEPGRQGDGADAGPGTEVHDGRGRRWRARPPTRSPRAGTRPRTRASRSSRSGRSRGVRVVVVSGVVVCGARVEAGACPPG